MFQIKTTPDPSVHSVMTDWHQVYTCVYFRQQDLTYLATVRTQKEFFKLPAVNDSVALLVQLMCLELLRCNAEQSYSSSSARVQKSASIQFPAVLLAAKSPLIDTQSPLALTGRGFEAKEGYL